jgi:hypothetical protein
MSVTTIPPGVKSLLWLRAGGRCQFEGCNLPLWKDGLTSLRMNASQMAHIVSDSSDGPRGNAVDSPRLAKAVSNLMLLCPVHHGLVDKKEHEARFPRVLLESMKEAHERRIELMTSIHGDKKTQIVTYWENVGEKKHFMAEQALLNAVLPNWYPASPNPVELAMDNSVITDGDEVFWSSQRLQLERQFNQLLKPSLGRDADHVSIFAVAPQPLLIHLGSLLSDLVPTQVYQLHREPQGWAWMPHADGVNPLPTLTRSGNPTGTPCIVIAISGEVARGRVENVLGQDVDCWCITVDRPHNDVLQSHEQLTEFRRIAREALEGVSQAHPKAPEIHVFPVAPVSACVEFGRVIQPRACLPLTLYNQTSAAAGFTRAISINGHGLQGKAS